MGFAIPASTVRQSNHGRRTNQQKQLGIALCFLMVLLLCPQPAHTEEWADVLYPAYDSLIAYERLVTTASSGNNISNLDFALSRTTHECLMATALSVSNLRGLSCQNSNIIVDTLIKRNVFAVSYFADQIQLSMKHHDDRALRNTTADLYTYLTKLSARIQTVCDQHFERLEAQPQPREPWLTDTLPPLEPWLEDSTR